MKITIQYTIQKFKGVVEGKVVVPEEPAVLADGTAVTINLPTNLRLLGMLVCGVTLKV
jgi:uncharacterized lipoprotein YmbA